jgi:2-succinyl-6-hydroxy-2,4-cyclohexadiene-1-carboxylate synthase
LSVRYLLLHGFTGAPASFARLPLPDGSLTPTLGGHLGEPVRGGFWDEVERLAALGADCQGLFGYSLGGRLALGILARYPERFRHAVIASAQPGLQSAEAQSERRAGDARLVELLRERGLTAFVDHWQALPLWASQGELSTELKAEQRALRLSHHADGLAESLIQHGLGEMPDLRPQLPAVRGLVDVVVGERDLKFVTLGRELTQLLPHATLTIMPGAGHNLLLERPAACAELLAHEEAT